jgi:hypothetical protein
MKGLALTFFVALASISGGCATADTEAQAKREEPVYITGSNIARKQHSGEVSVMSADGYQATRMPANVPTMPGGGH